MTTSPIGSSTAASISSASNPSGSTSNAAAGLTQNFNTFLTLLTTQLQNQDPLSPLDTNQFTQQLVSFSQVEQQINTNSNLQQLIALQGAGESISALPLVGQNIEYNSPTAPLSNGQANFVYNLPSATASTALTVVNANGNVVYTQPGDTGAGTHIFNWNGKTNAGLQLADGNYTLQIQAVGTGNTPVTPSIASIGAVQAVGVQNGAATFTVNGMADPMSELVTVNPNLTQTN
jgi:flagellar basal-body rod modification protein FlgD